MPDIALQYTEHGDFDFVVEGGDLLGDDGLRTAAIISLYSDRLARDDDPLPEFLPGHFADRRGWWGDLLREDGRRAPIGSRLWLLSREKEQPEVLARAREYAVEALAWVARAGGAYTCEARQAGPGRLEIAVAAKAAGPGQTSGRWSFFVDYSAPVTVDLLGASYAVD